MSSLSIRTVPGIELIRRIEARLANLGNEPWLPDLTRDLADTGWRRLKETIGLTQELYGTARVMSGDPGASLNLIADIPVPLYGQDFRKSIPIETLPESFTEQFRKQGAEFYTATEILDSSILNCIDEAIHILSTVPTIVGTVTKLVRSLHVLKPPNGVVDVSFSEPDIPFSAFISVPEVRVPNDALRIAEAILHEAMHLQLTLIERSVTLVRQYGPLYFSPWRKEYRPAEGILHAMYVFRVIHDFFRGALSAPGVVEGLSHYAQQRQVDISEQMALMSQFVASEFSTPSGSAFAHQLVIIQQVQ